MSQSPSPTAAEGPHTLQRSRPWLLPSNVRARSYQLELEIDPDQPTFRGTSSIDVALKEPSEAIVLHGRQLTIFSAWAQQGDERFPARTGPLPGADPRATPDELLLTFDKPLGGEATLHLEFEGKYRSDLRGLYRVQSDNKYYVFSQFEPMDARGAFPCFDEPDQKVPFAIRLKVPKGQSAFSNMNETGHSSQGEWTTFEFATSPAMPTYLVALAAGPLEVLTSSATAGMGSTPIRLIATNGKSHRGELALQWTREHLALLEQYFAMPYPYPKLDIVAVPQFAAGAMENAGLVTFREELLLVTKDSSTAAVRRMASVVAHELAHMWFGDLVTMRWWDDLWLNEGFATWMSAKIVDQWRPSLEIRQGSLMRLNSAMTEDSRPSARTMQQPVMTQTDAFRSFSGITYAKGASILSMVEQWVGPDSFRESIGQYLREHAWKNATSHDLFTALGGSAYPVAEVIRSFTTQTAVPYVDFQWTCNQKELSIQLRQQPYTPLGLSPVTPQATWKVPVCARFENGGKTRKECTLLEREESSWTVPVAECPQWVAPNADQSGYYRWKLSKTALSSLAVVETLTAREQVGWLLDARAMLDAGDLLVADYLQAARQHLETSQRPSTAWSSFLGTIQMINEEQLEPQQRPAFNAWLNELLEPSLNAMGLNHQPSGSDSETLLRSTVVRAAGTVSSSPKVIQWAEEVSDRWLSDPNSVSSEDAAVALPIAGTVSSKARFARLLEFAQHTPIAEHRTLAWRAAGATNEFSQAKELLQLAVDEQIEPGDFPYFLPQLLRRKALRAEMYPWFTEHFDQLVEKIPLFTLRGLVAAAISRCEVTPLQEIDNFFLPRLSKLEGMDGVLKTNRERATHCKALKEKNRASLATFVSNQ